MVSLTGLLLPILLSAVIVFIGSSVIHMFLGYHRSDFSKVPNEDALRAALKEQNIPPGEYFTPYAAHPSEMSDPAMMQKYSEGPVVVMTVLPNGPPAMVKNLVQWFVYSLVIGVFVAYVASRALIGPQEYMAVFRLTGTVAFLGYAGALAQGAIWTGRSWSTVAKSVFDGFVYGLLTAGVFGWLWPQ